MHDIYAMKYLIVYHNSHTFLSHFNFWNCGISNEIVLFLFEKCSIKLHIHVNFNSYSYGESFLIIPWWRHQMETFSRCWPFVRGITHTKASDAELWCFLWSTSDWVNNGEAGDLRRHRARFDVTLMSEDMCIVWWRCEPALSQLTVSCHPDVRYFVIAF